MQSTEKIINLSDIKRKKIFEETGLDADDILLCFNSCQFLEILKQLLFSGKNVIEVLVENTDLYKVGYLNEEDGKVELFYEKTI